MAQRWTYAQVATEAEAIVAEGGKPTARLIQQRLGGNDSKPSMGTIHKFFRQWEDARSRPRAAIVDIPEIVRNAVVEFIEAEVRARTTELDAKIASAQTAADDLATDNDRLEIDLANAKAQQANLEVARLEAATQAEERQKALDDAKAEMERDRRTAELNIKREMEAAEGARKDLALAELRLENIPSIQAKADRAEELAAQKADLAARVELTTQQLADTASKLLECRNKLDEIVEDRDRIRAELAEATASTKVLTAQKSDLERDRDNEKRERQREVAALKERIAELTDERNQSRAMSPHTHTRTENKNKGA